MNLHLIIYVIKNKTICSVSASKHDALVLQQFFCYTSRIINGGTFYVSFSNGIILEGLQTMAITDQSQSGLPDDDCLAFLKVPFTPEGAKCTKKSAAHD